MSSNNQYLKSLVGILAASIFTVSASAQQIDEIIVTAQKKEESLQDIPMAVTAISAAQIAEDGIKDLNDIQGRTPGLVVANFSVGQPEIAIRGIGTKEDGAAAGDSTVVSVDDVYIAARTAQIFDIFDIERVEVLRGPQGTLVWQEFHWWFNQFHHQKADAGHPYSFSAVNCGI